MTKTFILWNCFHFSHRFFHVPKSASNLEQFGGRHQESCQCASGFYSKFGWLGTNFQYPEIRQQRKTKSTGNFQSQRTCFLSWLTAVNSVLRTFSVRRIYVIDLEF